MAIVGDGLLAGAAMYLLATQENLFTFSLPMAQALCMPRSHNGDLVRSGPAG
jgi:hypothetical protein